jgi:hypothetical protein
LLRKAYTKSTTCASLILHNFKLIISNLFGSQARDQTRRTFGL